MPLFMERSKSKIGAEMLDSFVLLGHNSLGYIKKKTKGQIWVAEEHKYDYSSRVIINADKKYMKY